MSSTSLRALLLAAALGTVVIGIGSLQTAAAAERPRVRVVALPIQATNKYTEICQACHQATGLGLEGAFPPLAGSEWLNGNPTIPIAIVLKGLQGEIAVKGKTYNSVMMAWESALNDDDLASTLTYARSQWGNRATVITAAQVKAARLKFKARTTPWTAAELRAIR